MPWIDHENKIQYWHGSCLRDLTLASSYTHIAVRKESEQSEQKQLLYMCSIVQV